MTNKKITMYTITNSWRNGRGDGWFPIVVEGRSIVRVGRCFGKYRKLATAEGHVLKREFIKSKKEMAK